MLRSDMVAKGRAKRAAVSPVEASVFGRYQVLDEPACVVRKTRPDVRLFVEPGRVVQEKDREGFPDRCIFLDGMFAGPPMLDNQRQHYVFDHHVGVVRAFTLATCEQAAVMIAGGLPLDGGVWNLYVNEPDLDAMLAAWLLLNHDRLLADEQRLLWDVMPLVRVEGVIDTHGLDMGVVSGLRPRQYASHASRLDTLRTRELELREQGVWRSGPLWSYAAEQLELLDRRLLSLVVTPTAPPSEPTSLKTVAWPSRRRAVLYQGERGIYEVERELKAVHGRSLAVVVLHRGAGQMTLLQVDPFLPKCLNDLYPLLNERDPNADGESGNVWGGSSDIGGSPRATGSGLPAEEVLRLVAEVFAVDARE